MRKKVLQAKDPLLRSTSKPVTRVDKKVLRVIADLKDTLDSQKDPEGVGLAAPQIGKNIRVFLIKHQGIEKIIINPEVVRTSSNKTKNTKPGKDIMEGCLSLPHYYGHLKRSSLVKIKYLNEKGKNIEEEFKDFFAQIVLHEIDHLNGILFVDRLIEQKKPLYKFDGKEWEEVEL